MTTEKIILVIVSVFVSGVGVMLVTFGVLLMVYAYGGLTSEPSIQVMGQSNPL